MTDLPHMTTLPDLIYYLRCTVDALIERGRLADAAQVYEVLKAVEALAVDAGEG